MPSAEQEAWAAARRAPRDADGHADLDAYRAELERQLAERHRRLETDARAAFRAMDGWHGVAGEEDWRAKVAEARADYDNGRFLIDQLGAERHLDPPLMAVLLVLRRRLIDEHGATGAAELMLVDLAVISYYHTLRVNGWLGNFAALIEQESFQKEGLSAKFQDRHGRHNDRVGGLRVEDHVQRFGEQLLPLLDRCNRMMLRNFKALRAMREGPAPSVSIGAAGQVNVGGVQQMNGARPRNRSVTST